MKDNTEQVHGQVPVDVAAYLLNEKRASIASLEQRNDVRVYIIPNQHLETPHYEVTRIRQNEIPEAASYELKTEIAKPVYQPKQAQVIEREQPLLQGFVQAPQPAPPRRPRSWLLLHRPRPKLVCLANCSRPSPACSVPTPPLPT
jgi:ribonuclease E